MRRNAAMTQWFQSIDDPPRHFRKSIKAGGKPKIVRTMCTAGYALGTEPM
jgi:hypothetical protein